MRRSEGTCLRCGASASDSPAWNAGTDPLQVYECTRCGAILDIGGHRW